METADGNVIVLLTLNSLIDHPLQMFEAVYVVLLVLVAADLQLLVRQVDLALQRALHLLAEAALLLLHPLHDVCRVLLDLLSLAAELQDSLDLLLLIQQLVEDVSALDFLLLHLLFDDIKCTCLEGVAQQALRILEKHQRQRIVVKEVLGLLRCLSIGV